MILAVYGLLQFMLSLIEHSPDIYIDEIQKQLLDLHNVSASLSHLQNLETRS
jgi:hypothetical protein